MTNEMQNPENDIVHRLRFIMPISFNDAIRTMEDAAQEIDRLRSLRAQSDVRAPAPQGEPVAWRVKNEFGHWFVTHEAALADTWRDVEKVEVHPLYTAPPPPADLAEVLENVRKGIEKLKNEQILSGAAGRIDPGCVPLELHKACLALTHMVKDSRS